MPSGGLRGVGRVAGRSKAGLTPVPQFTPENAREAGRRGGLAKAKRNLTHQRLTDTLGELETPADAKRWLRTIAQWAACWWLSGISATACVRAVQEWQRVHESTATFDAIEELRATVRDLQHERDALTLENEQLALRRAEGLREHH